MQATFCLLKSNTVFFNFPPQGFLWWKIKIPPACSSVFRDRGCTSLNPSTMASYKATDLLHGNCALLKHSLYLSESNHSTCTLCKLTIFFKENNLVRLGSEGSSHNPGITYHFGSDEKPIHLITFIESAWDTSIRESSASIRAESQRCFALW